MIREGYEIANRFGHRPFVYQFLYAALEADLRTGEWDDNIAELDAIEENETPWPFYQIAFSGSGPCELRCVGTSRRPRRCCAGLTATLPELQSIQSEAYRPSGAGCTFCSRRGAGKRRSSTGARQAPTPTSRSKLVDHRQCGGSRRSAGGLGRGIRGDRVAGQLPRPEPRCAPRRRPAALAAREGRWEEAHAGFSAAIRHLTEQGELYYVALAGLLWDALSAGRDPDAAEAGRRRGRLLRRASGVAVRRALRSAFVPSGPEPRSAGRRPGAALAEA